MNSDNLVWQVHRINKAARSRRNGQKPCVLWFTGLSGAGKSTLADALECRLHQMGFLCYLLDGDNVRHGLCRDLGFSATDRIENIRRIAEVARLFVDGGLIVLTAFISPFRSDRDAARALVEPGEFVEIFVETPLAECERRDPKGLYRRARAGEIRDFTGIDSPYEAPLQPEIRLDTATMDPNRCVEVIIGYLGAHGYLPRA
ncbi:MAG: adenylyl-sulfate kinase [Rhodocyclaceae bacterium]|nr:adenylyl-sulfate kinase [Rhodocyclaceae bacterium]